MFSRPSITLHSGLLRKLLRRAPAACHSVTCKWHCALPPALADTLSRCPPLQPWRAMPSLLPKAWGTATCAQSALRRFGQALTRPARWAAGTSEQLLPCHVTGCGMLPAATATSLKPALCHPRLAPEMEQPEPLRCHGGRGQGGGPSNPARAHAVSSPPRGGRGSGALFGPAAIFKSWQEGCEAAGVALIRSLPSTLPSVPLHMQAGTL